MNSTLSAINAALATETTKLEALERIHFVFAATHMSGGEMSPTFVGAFNLAVKESMISPDHVGSCYKHFTVDARAHAVGTWAQYQAWLRVAFSEYRLHGRYTAAWLASANDGPEGSKAMYLARLLELAATSEKALEITTTKIADLTQQLETAQAAEAKLLSDAEAEISNKRLAAEAAETARRAAAEARKANEAKLCEECPEFAELVAAAPQSPNKRAETVKNDRDGYPHFTVDSYISMFHKAMSEELSTSSDPIWAAKTAAVRALKRFPRKAQGEYTYEEVKTLTDALVPAMMSRLEQLGTDILPQDRKDAQAWLVKTRKEIFEPQSAPRSAARPTSAPTQRVQQPQQTKPATTSVVAAPTPAAPAQPSAPATSKPPVNIFGAPKASTETITATAGAVEGSNRSKAERLCTEAKGAMEKNDFNQALALFTQAHEADPMHDPAKTGKRHAKRMLDQNEQAKLTPDQLAAPSEQPDTDKPKSGDKPKRSDKPKGTKSAQT